MRSYNTAAKACLAQVVVVPLCKIAAPSRITYHIHFPHPSKKKRAICLSMYY